MATGACFVYNLNNIIWVDEGSIEKDVLWMDKGLIFSQGGLATLRIQFIFSFLDVLFSPFQILVLQEHAPD